MRPERNRYLRAELVALRNEMRIAASARSLGKHRHAFLHAAADRIQRIHDELEADYREAMRCEPDAPARRRRW